ncbi:MAG: phospho-sugar mutase [Erysipelotrichaceae bacterium]|nr:phospho-sugar mutase [Erysipelotrichaceae bacterium]
MIKEKYEKWLNHPGMDADLVEEMKNMNEEQMNDAFYKDSEFGTAGMRGLLGAGTNRLNVYTIRKATLGFARFLKEGAKVAIAYDNRFKSKEFADESAKILAANGIRSFVFESLRTTPELSYAVRYLKCDGGIMITASHNPKEYNGYKVYDKNGCQMVPELVKGVIDEINAIGDQLVDTPVLTRAQQELIVTVGENVDKPYFEDILSIQLRPELDKKDFTIVYTPQHGTSYLMIKRLFDAMGYHCVYVEEQCNPDPAFSNTLSPNPEEKKAYKLAIEYGERVNADIILTTDPDGDRLGVAALKNGKYEVLTGNQGGAVLLKYILTTLKDRNQLPANGVMFNTVVTSDLGDKVCNKFGVEVEKTLTGFKYIGDKIAKYEVTKEKEFVFGYEESYGYLLKEFVRDKDANQSCLMLAEAANYYKKQGKNLWDVLEDIYQEYGCYLESQRSTMYAGADGNRQMKAMLEKVRANIPSELAGHKVVKYQDFLSQKEYEGNQCRDLKGFDVSDVLKFFLDDESWIAIRPSGTEPKCKFYFCITGKDHQETEKKQEAYYQAIDELVK